MSASAALPQPPSREVFASLGRLRLARFDALSLRWAALRSADSALAVIRRGALRGFTHPSWGQYRKEIKLHLAAMNDDHCFGVPVYAWAELQEPQITKGLVHFLADGSFAERAARSLALLKAVNRTTEPGAKVLTLNVCEVSRMRVYAEGPASRRQRIDIVVIVQSNDGKRFGAIIEAKVGHHVTDGQLATYQLAASKPPYLLAPENTSFVVIAPSRSTGTVRQLRRNPAWRFLAWRSFIPSLCKELAKLNCDNEDFRRFRRTVWQRAA